MKKTELNDIIMNKIDKLNDSQSMKNFIIRVLDIERYNVVYAKPQYTKEYVDLATNYSNKEER